MRINDDFRREIDLLLKMETRVWKQVTARVFQHALNHIIKLQVDRLIQVHKTRPEIKYLKELLPPTLNECR